MGIMAVVFLNIRASDPSLVLSAHWVYGTFTLPLPSEREIHTRSALVTVLEYIHK